MCCVQPRHKNASDETYYWAQPADAAGRNARPGVAWQVDVRQVQNKTKKTKISSTGNEGRGAGATRKT